VVVATVTEGNNGLDRVQSEESEKRIIGSLKRVRDFGRAFCNWTIRTLSTCFGRGRSTADFNALVTKLPINKDKPKQMTNARALNPPNKSALIPTARNNGLQISASLNAAMNKSKNGLIHCWLIK